MPNLKYSFFDAFSEILPRMMPGLLQEGQSRQSIFAVPGYDVALRLPAQLSKRQTLTTLNITNFARSGERRAFLRV